MEKRSIKNKRREEEKLLTDRAARVRAALNANIMVRKEICNATGLTMLQLKNLFQKDRELFAEYAVLRKTIMDVAADNLVAIVNDPTHPHHFQASKEMLKNFKSDFDDTLEGVDSILNIQPSGKKSKVKIVFSSTSSKS